MSRVHQQALQLIQNDNERQRGSRAAARGGCGFNQGESLPVQAAQTFSARVSLAPA